MATGKDTVCTSFNGISLKLLQIISLCSDSFTTWRTAFIKQAPFSTHRTLHETFGARRPSSVFFGNRFRSADCQKIQLPPGGSQGGLYEFALDFIKLQVPTATPQPLRRQLSSALSGCTPSRTATPAKPFRGAWGFPLGPASSPFRGAWGRHRPLRS